MARRSKSDPDAPDLSVERIVGAAIELLDESGVEAFSLRAVARHLGASNMSLYYYVKDRDELLALVLDDILRSVNLRRLPDDPFDALAVLSKRFVAAFVAHPGTIPLFALRPLYSIGPHAVAVFDRFVGLLRAAELPDDTVADATVALIEYLCGHLIGHLPEVQHPASNHGATVDELLDTLPDGAAPNIRAVGPHLRRAASTLEPSVGINLFLAGLTAQTGDRSQR
jgi:AcrR family transcriptional regulator